jgi:hypothetical protein
LGHRNAAVSEDSGHDRRVTLRLGAELGQNRPTSEEGVLLDSSTSPSGSWPVRVDEEGDVDLELRSHCFGGWTTTFVPPGQEAEDGVERNAWWVIQERLDDEGLPVVHHAEALSVTDLVDKIPTQFEIWVFVVTETQVGRLAAAAEFETPTAEEDVKDGVLLRTDLEQAKAHAKTWESRFERRYGDLYLYELRDDARLVWERGEIAGLKALLVSEADDDGQDRRAYVAPDLRHGWRWTSERHLEAAGEYLPVHEVLARVPVEHRDWVRRLTDEAYGKVVEALAARSARACASDRSEDFAELARLAAHAEAPAVCREAEPFMPGH